MTENNKPSSSAAVPSQAQSRHRFLPFAPLPADLPSGKVPIAEMANAFGVTHRTLHFYEEKGLISASRMGLMRVYDRGDIMRMAIINLCRDAGMAVAVIQELMNELADADSQESAESIFRTALLTRKRELTAEMSTLHRQLRRVTDLLDQDIEDDDAPLNDNLNAAALTEQESRCLVLMAEGQSTQRIARTLDLPQEDAEFLEAGIIRKLHANNRFQAIAKAVLLGIVQV